MELLYFLEKIRIPGLNEFMLLITHLGEETAFLVMALIVFWCVDKRKGYYIMAVGFIGTITNQFMKLWFRIPRPWVLDENFTILEEARAEASGYSFPSGHSQSAVGTFGGIAACSKERWLKICGITISVLVPISRMYVGVHTPADVLVGSGMALALVLLLKPLMLGKKERSLMPLLAVMVAMAVGLLLFVELYPFPADVDIHNLQSGLKNAYTLLGSLAGVAVVYVLDRKYIHFTNAGVWWAQVLKAVLGLVLVLAVKEGMRSPLDVLFAGHLVSRAVRYFLIVLTAGALWPLTFRWFATLGRKECAK